MSKNCNHPYVATIQPLGRYALEKCKWCNSFQLNCPDGFVEPLSMRQTIILAIANGCTNHRQIAKWLDMSHHSTTSNYFYEKRDTSFADKKFINGNIIQWTPNKTNTLRLADSVLKHESEGFVVGVYGILNA